MNEKLTQKEAILSFLKTGERLTGLQALQTLGCMRLAARINELRQEGHNIKSEKIRVGNGKLVSSYRMVMV